ncbi:MAG: Hsp70 family protein [Victivallales bacterium]|nr:Hsp70 family protein [Victivallales bacterium]
MDASRYVVGIDLGTTNCALAFVDTVVPEGERRVRVLPVPQLVAPGEVAERPALPSFIYLPEAHDEVPETLALPWHDSPPTQVVGTYARQVASRTPGKVVASAKSWLCYENLDRRADVLPYDRTAPPRRISPVTASRLCLEHLRDAWNWQMAREDQSLRLEDQDVMLTVPASFDAVARELTVEAARQAGLNVRLLEEPQAAFYSWLHTQGENWRQNVADGDVILVCDIGGGTTDFTLIAVLDDGGDLALERLAVGEHTLLGGDNMDLTLAYTMAAKIQRDQGTRLDAYQIAALTHACRDAKEHLGAGAETAQPLTILGRGTGLVGGTITTEITAEELHAALVDGFFPACTLDDRPAERRKVGLRTFGLDYAADPGLTKHLAAFLDRHRLEDEEGNVRLPNVVLFNGGVTKADAFRNRVTDAIQGWNQYPDYTITVLDRHDPDLSVALGAAWYGIVQRGGGVRIKAGSARSYYLGIESSLPAVPGFAPPMEALCVVNFGLEEGSSVDVAAEGLGLVVGEPTEFRVFSSTVRPEDPVGECLFDWSEDELEELPPVVAELPADEKLTGPVGSLVPVRLRTELTEIGTIQLWCDHVAGEGSWKLEFDIRESAE